MAIGRGIGSLRHKVTIQQPTDSKSARGGVTQTWATYHTAYAAIEPLSGGEGQAGRMESGTITHRIRIRYKDGITAKMRVVFGSRTFDISGPPTDPTGRREEMHLIGVERIQ